MKDWRAPLEQDEIARPIVFFVLLFGGAALVEIFVLVHLLGIRDLLVMSLFFFACATVGLLLFARWQTGSWNPGGAVRARWREREAGSFRHLRRRHHRDVRLRPEARLDALARQLRGAAPSGGSCSF